MSPGTIAMIAVAMAAWLVDVRSFAADQEPAGITVSATGEARIKPTRMEIEIKASAAAELTTDAVVKYREALKHAREAFEKLKVQNLSISDEGVNVAGNGGPTVSPYLNQAQENQTTVKPEVAISKSLRLKVSRIDKMSEEEVVALTAR